MLIEIPNLLSPEQVAYCKQLLLNADWADGSITAGSQSTKAKNNLQLPHESAVAEEIGEIIMVALANNATFMSAALPAKIFPPLFNCYQGGQSFDVHIDNAIRQVPGTPVKVRTDLSMTVFFSAPEEYDGGELMIQDTFGNHNVKLPAGSMVLYPSTSLHKVSAVTRGRRLASFFWMQSLINSDEKRSILYQMDNAIQSLRAKVDNSEELIKLTGVYHNLLRQWAQT